MPGSKVDYDGDGNVEEGIYEELEGVQALLLQAIQAYAAEVAGTPIVYDAAAIRTSSRMPTPTALSMKAKKVLPPSRRVCCKRPTTTSSTKKTPARSLTMRATTPN